ncbi:WecB/TagA/CpsF family glycosyltransferase [Gordonia rubripertincta]|uniref:WecB/TagA/CpsF family glycosyltransferase n=1 Tax=Gordonia rubripertincta TaxID=36822 RepID=UPI000E5A5A1E
MARPVPGGIDTCIRGLCRFADPSASFAIVGVDAIGDRSRLGEWEAYDLNGRTVWFMPVASLDPADQRRRIPHTVRLLAGLLRFLVRLPKSTLVQAHRADSAFLLAILFRRPLAYFIHTQDSGITSQDSDSVWRRISSVHRSMERWVVRRADSVTVFNPDYAEKVRELNSECMSSPTWFDPAVFYPEVAQSEPADGRKVIRVVWVGRLERPKDPVLALDVFKTLSSMDAPGNSTVRLDIIGDGTERETLNRLVAEMSPDVRERVTLRGRLGAGEVADVLRASSVFLMTSHPGYEGYPRVLVEALACGTPAVVTCGSDTGGLVRDGVTGFVANDRNPETLAAAVARAIDIDPAVVSRSVGHLSADRVVERIIPPISRSCETDTRPMIIGPNADGTLAINGMPVFSGDMDELVDQLAVLLNESHQRPMVVTPNVDQVVTLSKNPQLRGLLDSASLRIVDGKPIVWLAKHLGIANVHRLTGADLLTKCAAESAARGWTVAIVGGPAGVAATAASNLASSYPGAQVYGLDLPNARVGEPAPPEVLQRLTEIAPDLVFVCLGFPKQEAWVAANRDHLPGAVYIGAGAAVEFAAGTKARAPQWMQDVGLEWLHRLGQEPSRLARRYLVDDTHFVRIAIASIWKAKA